MELQPLKSASAEQIFKKIETDEDGSASGDEILDDIREEVYRPLSTNLVREVQQWADEDLDNRLSSEEIVQMPQEPEPQKIMSYMKRGAHGYINFITPPHARPVSDTSAADGVYDDLFTCWPPPITMILITLTQVLIFCYDAFAENGSIYGEGPLGKLLIFDPRRRKEYWRFLSYMFVHIGSFHLIVNSVVQVMLGLPLEMVNRGGRVTLVYVAGVIAGSLGVSIIHPNLKLAGATGVYSLLTAHIATIILNWKEMEFPLVQLVICALPFGTDAGKFIYTKFYLMKESHVNYIADYFGALAGLLVGITFLKSVKVTEFKSNLRWISFIVYWFLLSGAIICHQFSTNRFPTQQV